MMKAMKMRKGGRRRLLFPRICIKPGSAPAAACPAPATANWWWTLTSARRRNLRGLSRRKQRSIWRKRSGLAIGSGRRAAALLPEAATTAAAKLGEKSFAHWLRLIDYANASAPESLASILERTAQLLARLDLEGLESWLRIGIRMAEGDGKRRLRFFTMEDPAGGRWLRRLGGETGFSDMELRLRPFLAALWETTRCYGKHPQAHREPAHRRAGFYGMVVRLPASFPGFSAADGERLYRAAVAHIAAHLKFSRERFPLGGLKPTQVALVSLIEDARVERLAMRELPGLARLFLPFHTIGPSSAITAFALFARLARALADPSYHDPDPWVVKGRDAFGAAEDEWDSQQISRRIGDLLGNDLGQMRIQFDPKTYVVHPPYRDDNLGLWDFGDDYRQADEAEQVLSTARVRQEENDKQPDRVEPENKPDGEAGKVRMTKQPVDGMLVARYPEFDDATGRAAALDLGQGISARLRCSRQGRPVARAASLLGRQADGADTLGARQPRRTPAAARRRVASTSTPALMRPSRAASASRPARVSTPATNGAAATFRCCSCLTPRNRRATGSVTASRPCWMSSARRPPSWFFRPCPALAIRSRSPLSARIAATTCATRASRISINLMTTWRRPAWLACRAASRLRRVRLSAVPLVPISPVSGGSPGRFLVVTPMRRAVGHRRRGPALSGGGRAQGCTEPNPAWRQHVLRRAQFQRRFPSRPHLWPEERYQHRRSRTADRPVAEALSHARPLIVQAEATRLLIWEKERMEKRRAVASVNLKEFLAISSP